MSEDLQSLLEKINREGVEKARAEADKIIADAKAKAADIVKTANAEAAKAKADAERPRQTTPRAPQRRCARQSATRYSR